MLARSVYKPAGGLVWEQAAVSQTQGIEAEFAKRSEANWSGKPGFA
jgi:hypothetical protein